MGISNQCTCIIFVQISNYTIQSIFKFGQMLRFAFVFHLKIQSSSSYLGMSNISANNGGSLISVQFVRSQFKCVQCLAPKALSSGIFASRAGINCNAVVDPGLERTICTRKASAIRSRVRDTCLCSVMPGRLAVNNINDENNPISVSLRPKLISPFEKFKNAVTKSF